MNDFNGSFGWLVKYQIRTDSAYARGVEVSSVSKDGVSLVVLGGALTHSVNGAMWYMSKVAPVLQPDFKDVALYCGYYQFNDVDPMLVKAHTFRMGGCRFPLSKQQEDGAHTSQKHRPQSLHPELAVYQFPLRPRKLEAHLGEGWGGTLS